MFAKLGGRLAVPAAAALLAVALPTAASAAVSPVQDPIPIGPKQFFTGLVLGKTAHSVIEVACAGAASTGHPVSGQSVEVKEVLPPVTPALGYTGARGRSIKADLIWSKGTVTVVTAIATFTSYYVKLPIPTKITVPCGGSGVMSFTPAPGSKTARSTSVDVTFVSPGA